MKKIPLHGPKGQGLVMLVSDEDYALMSRVKWNAKVDRDGTVSAQATISAHSLLTGFRLTDHADGNKLNNTRTNLRDATPRQNSWNRGRRSDSKHDYKGVHFSKTRQRYRARIQVGDKRIWSNYYADVIDAARAYDALARKHYGKFARLNFPDEPNFEAPPPPVRSCAQADCGKEFQFRQSNAIYCSRRCAKIAGVRDHAARLKADPSLAPHGTMGTYCNWGCRCEACSEAMSLYSAERYRRRKEAA